MEKAIQLIESIGYRAKPGNGYLIVEYGDTIHIVMLDKVQAWVGSH